MSSFNIRFGMTCGHCERAVTQALQQVDPDAQVRIDRASGKVDVDSTAPREALAAAIAEEAPRHHAPSEGHTMTTPHSPHASHVAPTARAK
eukprot:gene46633-58146_t